MEKWYLHRRFDGKLIWIFILGFLYLVHQYFSDYIFFCISILVILLMDFRVRKKMEIYEATYTVQGQNYTNRFYHIGTKIFHSEHREQYAIACLNIHDRLSNNAMYSYEVNNKKLREISTLVIDQLNQGELFCRESAGRYLFMMHKDIIWQQMRQMMDVILENNSWMTDSSRYSINCGIYVLDKQDEDIRLAIDRASLACQQAYQYHRNWISSYDDTMRYQENREHWIEAQMIEALARGEFKLYYQPKIRLEDGCMVGAEVLVRWVDEEGTVMCPDEFISVMEKNSFIIRMDLDVFDQACRQLRVWLDAGYDVVPLSINISSSHLYQPDFYGQFLEIMQRYRIEGRYIELELKESVLGNEYTYMPFIIDELKAVGIKLYIDDFGSNTVSFRRLNELLVGGIKIDRVFFHTAMKSKRGKLLLQHIKSMADGLDMDLSVQGVETIEQVEFLKSINCCCVQGFYYAEPMPLNIFEKYAYMDKK